MKKIKIKTEKDIERQLGIKVERVSIDEQHSNEPHPSEDSEAKKLAEEKTLLINDLMTLKSENQSLVQNLKSATVLKHELQTCLNEKDSEFSTKFNELKRKLDIATEKEANNTKIISDLKKENSLLLSQNKQLKNGLAQAEEKNSDSDESDVYEVESILNDKLVTERQYLVRWKGYDATEDSWERESNLKCQSILKKYKRLKIKK